MSRRDAPDLQVGRVKLSAMRSVLTVFPKDETLPAIRESTGDSQVLEFPGEFLSQPQNPISHGDASDASGSIRFSLFGRGQSVPHRLKFADGACVLSGN